MFKRSVFFRRYYAILHPLRARHVHTVRRALTLIGIFWAASFVLVVPQLFLQRLEPKLTFEDPPRMAEVSVKLHTHTLARARAVCNSLAAESSMLHSACSASLGDNKVTHRALYSTSQYAGYTIYFEHESSHIYTFEYNLGTVAPMMVGWFI
jgi:hypothetical protein